MNSRSGRDGAPWAVYQALKSSHNGRCTRSYSARNPAHPARSAAGYPENVGGTSGALISSGLQDTIRTNGTPPVTSAGKPTTLSSTMTSGLARSTIARSCSWQYLAPPMSSSQTGLIQVSSCSIVGLRNSGAVCATKSFQNCPASWSPSAGEARSTRSSSKPSGSSLPFHDASAAKTTRCPRLRSTSPIPMQLLVGPYALSGMNRIVSGLAGMGAAPHSAGTAASGPAVLPEGCHVRRGRVHRPPGGSPYMTNGDFRIHGRSPGDLEYEPWKDGVNGGYRFGSHIVRRDLRVCGATP